jgi:aminoglycoside/choline kinase family phosphotransferase
MVCGSRTCGHQELIEFADSTALLALTTMTRTDSLNSWLTETLGQAPKTLEIAAVDASVRSYWRAVFSDRSLIIMDAIPADFDCQPFLQQQQRLANAGLPVPSVLAQNLEQGWVLLEDLGTKTLASLIDADNAANYYRQAISLLVKMQVSTPIEGLAPFDGAFMQREMDICREWYFGKAYGVTLEGKDLGVWERSCALIVAHNMAQPTLFMHRDFHSRNIMVQDDALRLIDFQDAVLGPITYDLVSLLKDAYLDWDEAFVLDLAIRYWEQARAAGLPVHEDFGDFYRAFEWQGLQRHLKILGLFARLKHRDGKEQYQADIPRVFEYVRKVCLRYSELTQLGRLLLNLHGEPVATGFTF